MVRRWLRRGGLLICTIVFLFLLWFLAPPIATMIMTKSVVTTHPDGSRWQVYRIKRWGNDAGKATVPGKHITRGKTV